MLKFLKGILIFAIGISLFFFFINFVQGKSTADYISQLSDASPAVRIAAARELAKTKSQKVAEALYTASLKEKNFNVRKVMEKSMYECSGMLTKIEAYKP